MCTNESSSELFCETLLSLVFYSCSLRRDMVCSISTIFSRRVNYLAPTSWIVSTATTIDISIEFLYAWATFERLMHPTWPAARQRLDIEKAWCCDLRSVEWIFGKQRGFPSLNLRPLLLFCLMNYKFNAISDNFDF